MIVSHGLMDAEMVRPGASQGAQEMPRRVSQPGQERRKEGRFDPNQLSKMYQEPAFVAIARLPHQQTIVEKGERARGAPRARAIVWDRRACVSPTHFTAFAKRVATKWPGAATQLSTLSGCAQSVNDRRIGSAVLLSHCRIDQTVCARERGAHWHAGCSSGVGTAPASS
jgi:hypothetical protein